MSQITSSRRAVLAGLAGTAALSALPRLAQAAAPAFQLDVKTREIEVNGKLAKRLAVFGPDGPEGLRLKRGDYFKARVVNHLESTTLIHWHGLLLPPSQDGVPGISAPAIQPGGYADYDFPLIQDGTYWMHSHVGLQEQLGLAMPLILEDPNDPLGDLQEVVMFLEDFTFQDPEEILRALEGGGEAATGGGTPADGMKMPAGSGMSGMGAMADLNDVEFDAYLANSRTLRDPEIVAVERGGRVRVRIINGSASTNFFISAGGLSARLIAVDGEPVEPIDDMLFPVAIAQRIDLLVDVPAGTSVPVLAHREGDTAQTGLILAAPGAAVAKLPDRGAKKSGAMGAELESRLRSTVPLPVRPVDTELLSALTGDMAAYVWEMHGGVYPDNEPLVVTTGERTAVRIRNETGMAHPMHLHGHVFQVVEIDGKPLAGAVRDTVLLPPNAEMVIVFDANNPGIWAYHCHNLYHMEAGMFSYVTYVPAT